MNARALSAAVLVVLAGCGGGPDRDALRRDVAARLGEALPGAKITFTDFDRRGSQSDVKAPSGESRRVVYFDASLKLERDFDFGAWGGPGVANLVSALGAGPKGITGIASGGNKAGDELRVRGTARYRLESGKWVAVASGGFRPANAPAYATNEAQGASAIVEGIHDVLASAPKDMAPATRAMIEEELTAAYAAIRARSARIAKGYAIAAGPAHGQYLRFAQALAGSKALQTVALVTRGGDDNLRLLREGKVALALAQGDAALDAYEGKGSFESEGPFRGLRAVGSLYPEAVHVLVREDSPYRRVRDLVGQRVAIGVTGAASRATVLRVLEAHDIGPGDYTPVELPIGQALLALRSRQADAVLQVIGVPADSIREADSLLPLLLLPLTDAAVARLTKGRGGYIPYRITRGAYPSQRDDVLTIATPAVLFAGAHLAASEVAAVSFFVYEQSRDFVARGSAQGAQVSALRARDGLAVPQHPAAAKAIEAMLKK